MAVRCQALTFKKPRKTRAIWHQDQQSNLQKPVQHENVGGPRSNNGKTFTAAQQHSSNLRAELKALSTCTGRMPVSERDSGWHTPRAPLPHPISPMEQFIWRELMFKKLDFGKLRLLPLKEALVSPSVHPMVCFLCSYHCVISYLQTHLSYSLGWELLSTGATSYSSPSP